MSHSDDSYISKSHENILELSKNLESTMSVHNDFLQSIGMVTNAAKTEQLYFSWIKLQYQPQLGVKDQKNLLGGYLKVLGVKFESDLGWNIHIRNVVAKVSFVLKKLRFISRFVETKDMLKIVTYHVFGTMFYGSTVWQNELTKSTHWRIISSIHYRAVRLTIGDNRNKLSRLTVDRISKQCNPHQ